MRLGQAAVDLEFPALLVGRTECISQHPLLQVVEFVRIVFCNLLRSSLKQLVKTWMVLLDHPNDLSQRQPVYKQHFHENKSRHSGGTRPDDRPSKAYIDASRLKRDGAETGHGAGSPANGQAGVKLLPTMLLPMEHQEFLKCFWLVHVITGSAVRLPFAASTVSRVTNKSTAAKAHCQYSRRCVSFFLAASTASGEAAGELIGRPNLLN